MSSLSQLLVVAVFLLYSAAYLMFVAWAAESSADKQRRFKPRLIVFLAGALLPLLGLIPLVQYS